MKKILGLDLGTNSIGWALISENKDKKEIVGLGSRIIPMSQDILDNFSQGISRSQTAERTRYRGVRRLHERHLLRRERLHRVLNVLKFLPSHYANDIDFEKNLGQFKDNKETKLAYANNNGKHEFLFKDSFKEMLLDFKENQPQLIHENKKIPYDWTIYYLRKKALTSKIEKEELAWLLLHFNQKRGYYQLRGEDDDDATRTAKTRKYFEKQVITNIIGTNEVYRGLKVLLVELSNGNKGKIFKKEVPDWIGTEKNIIATVELDKDGNDKYYDNGMLNQRFSIPTDTEWETEWKLIKLKTEKDLSESNKTVGCYIYDTLLQNPKQKIRGKLVCTIERKFYKEELKLILDKQKEFHPELNSNELYKACLNELYKNNDSHKNSISGKDFTHLFLNDIIFYQRPLKSKKSLISNCPYEHRIFSKDLKKEVSPIKCIAKSNPLYQEFRLWQFIYNLRIYEREKVVNGKLQADVDVTSEFLKSEDDYIALFEYLNGQNEINQNNLLTRYFKINKKKGEDNLPFRWNYIDNKDYPCNETFAQISTLLKKCNNISADFLTKEREFALWHILYSIEDKAELEKALQSFAKKNNLADDFVILFLKFPKIKKEYGSYSAKAIKKLLPLMRRGKYWNEKNITSDTKNRINAIVERLKSINYNEKQIDSISDDAIPKQVLKSFIRIPDPFKGLNTYLACYAVYGRHSEVSEIGHWKKPDDIDNFLQGFRQHSLRNPIVEQVLRETLKVVKDIWIDYGKSAPDFFNEIHIELGREMKNPADKRKRISEQVTENENTNLRMKALLMEMINDPEIEGIRPYSPYQQEILKLYEEGVLNSEIEIPDDILKISKQNQPSKNELTRYKLWLNQKYRSPYTGEIIPLNKLFTSAYQIEHVIPQSRYFDDSLSNKIICEAVVNANPYKDNQLAYEFIKNNSGKLVPELSNGKEVRILSISAYEKLVKETFSKNRSKMKKLLMEEIPEDFIQRQMNDSRYISKVIKGYLSNLVRNDDELEATSKNVIPTNGNITSTLKQDWGLNDVWNEIITSRFERLNSLTNSSNFGEWTNKNGKNVFQINMPLELQKGFTKKRIDHRHHALDALVIACTTQNHINYLNNEHAKQKDDKLRYDLRNKLRRLEEIEIDRHENGQKIRKKIIVAKEFYKPWDSFTQDARQALATTLISFKQNVRVINKAVNKYQHWDTDENGKKKKVLKEQKGVNWAIRKNLHTPMPYGKKVYTFDILKIADNTGKANLIISKEIKDQVNEVILRFDKKITTTQKYLKENPIKDKDGKPILVTAFKVKTEKFRRRQSIYKLSNRGQGGIKKIEDAIKFINKIADLSLQQALLKHLEDNENDIDKAFGIDGIEIFIEKQKTPIYKIPIAEQGEKRFALGNSVGNKHKWVEAFEGTNLFFAIYHNTESGTRSYYTIPLNEIIEIEKQNAQILKEKKLKKPDLSPVPLTRGNNEKLLFYLSPNDLVYVPSKEEQEMPHLVNFKNLTSEQANRIYKTVSSSGYQCFFIKSNIANSIVNKVEFSALNKMEKSIDGIMIKEVCWKIKVNRIGKIIEVNGKKLNKN